MYGFLLAAQRLLYALHGPLLYLSAARVQDVTPDSWYMKRKNILNCINIWIYIYHA